MTACLTFVHSPADSFIMGAGSGGSSAYMTKAEIDRKKRGACNLEQGELDDLVGYKIRRLELLMSQDFHARMDHCGVTPALFATLVLVKNNPGLRQVELGRALGIAKSGAMLIINRLEALGLVERSPDREDRRSFQIYLTSSGETKLPGFMRIVRKHDRDLYAALGDQEYEQFRTLLTKLLRLT